jgi:hypothetical protein
MKIRLVVTIEGHSARWQRDVERSYAGVPRAGDWVYLGESTEGGEGLMATPVAVVTWENDGAVALRFDVAGAGPESLGYLEGLGFTRV